MQFTFVMVFWTQIELTDFSIKLNNFKCKQYKKLPTLCVLRENSNVKTLLMMLREDCNHPKNTPGKNLYPLTRGVRVYVSQLDWLRRENISAWLNTKGKHNTHEPKIFFSSFAVVHVKHQKESTICFCFFRSFFIVYDMEYMGLCQMMITLHEKPGMLLFLRGLIRN